MPGVCLSFTIASHSGPWIMHQYADQWVVGSNPAYVWDDCHHP